MAPCVSSGRRGSPSDGHGGSSSSSSNTASMSYPIGRATSGMARTTRATPLIGATAIRGPRISSAVAPASSAAPTVQWYDTGAAPSASSAPRRISAWVLGSSPDVPSSLRAMARTDLMHSSSCSARRRSCSSCPAIIDLLAVVWLLDEEAEVAGVLNGLAARRHPELPVDRHGLRLHGVLRQGQLRPHPPERVGGSH